LQKPVLIDLWATWCKKRACACPTMDKTTFEDPAVVAALSGYVKTKFQAEDPDTPAAREVMTRLNAIGLPAYGVLRANGPSQSASPGSEPSNGGAP
jgi:thiol:disulfide interchange protein